VSLVEFLAETVTLPRWVYYMAVTFLTANIILTLGELAIYYATKDID
jgi:hypothetical protein